MNIQEIKDFINDEKNEIMSTDFSKYGFESKEEQKKHIEAIFLLVNDITDRREEFDADVDYDEVCEFRSNALFDVLEHFDLR
jgi:hypothetical protein